MDYDSALKEIKKLENFGSKPGLERIKKLLSMVGHPQNSLNCVHVAGTNGKGSVCFMLSSVLSESGYKVGRYTSPSVCDFRERIAINGREISKKDFTGLVEYFIPYLNHPDFQTDPITEFELTTAMAFKFFEKEKCDIAVIETGMGGKLDATNVIEKPICSVLTSVDLDHTKILGDSIEKITSEKCGIIKPNCPVVIADRQPSPVYEIAKNTAYIQNSNMLIARESELQNINFHGLNGISFEYKNTPINTKILGRHQLINIACTFKAIEILQGKFSVDNKNIKKAMENLKIPYRIELRSKNPKIILDACHNPQGTKALANFLKSNSSGEKFFGIVGMFKDKNYDLALKNLSGIFEKVYTISPPSPRAESLEVITACAKKYHKCVILCESLQIALNLATTEAKNKDIIVIFGSFSVMNEFENIDFQG